MQSLIEKINTYAQLSDSEIELLKNSVEKRVYKKGETIFEEGNISEEIYFLTSGCVRLFYWVEGTDRTAFFYTEGLFFVAGESFTFNVPAIENFQAIEESEIYIFKKDKIELLLEKISKFEIIARIATENELITYQKLVASFVTKSPEERYVDLLENQAELFQRVPQQYIDSYLGVSPETLSRIKARVINELSS